MRQQSFVLMACIVSVVGATLSSAGIMNREHNGRIEKMKTHVLSIDAWRDPEGWTWNAWYTLGYELVPRDATNRQLLKLARERGYLTDFSKGRVAIDDDGYNMTVINRHTGEPIIAFCYGEFEEEG